jgi:hypothetical protein
MKRNEQIKDWCYQLSLKHGVNHWFFVDRMLNLKPKSKKEAEKCMDWMLFHAFHHHFDEVFGSLRKTPVSKERTGWLKKNEQ